MWRISRVGEPGPETQTLVARLEKATGVSISLTPRQPGVYAWYFRRSPPRLPTDGCHRQNDATRGLR